MKLKKKLIWILFISGILLLGFIAFISQYAYIVPKNNYSILDQSGDIRIESYPKLKEVKFMYNTDLYIEFTRPINLELEKINFRINDEIIGIIEINKNLNDLENFAEPYIDEKTKEKSIRKIYLVQNDFLKILGKKNEKYKVGTGTIEGRFYIDIYIKDLKTNKTFIIKRDNIHIYYESAGIKLFSM